MMIEKEIREKTRSQPSMKACTNTSRSGWKRPRKVEAERGTRPEGAKPEQGGQSKGSVHKRHLGRARSYREEGPATEKSLWSKCNTEGEGVYKDMAVKEREQSRGSWRWSEYNQRFGNEESGLAQSCRYTASLWFALSQRLNCLKSTKEDEA